MQNNTQPCKLVVVGATQGTALGTGVVGSTQGIAVGTAYPGVPILPKPHTLLLPVEYDIQDGNKFRYKNGTNSWDMWPKTKSAKVIE